MAEVTIQASRTQRAFLSAILDENSAAEVVGFGGARGGGKTWASAFAATVTCLMYRNVKVLLLRRGLASATNNFRDEVKKVLRQLGCSKAGRWYTKEHLFRFVGSGSELHLGFVDREKDYEAYQGVEYARIGLEEGTQHLALNWDMVSGSNRSNNPACRPVRWVTCNPGGVGHAWIRERFVDASTRGPGHEWIASTLRDCPFTLINDPGYVQRVLDPLPDWQRRQWRDGDWDAIAGQFWSIPPHLVRDVAAPPWAEWYGGVDWGKAKPFACVWLACWKEWPWSAKLGRFIEVDRAHFVSEVYEAGLDLDEQAQRVREMEERLPLGSKQVLYYADPKTGAELEGESTEAGRTIQNVWSRHGFSTVPARTNARVPGWNLWKLMMRHGTITYSPQCVALLSEMRAAQTEGAPGPPTGEDLKQGTGVEDHAMDAGRYALVSVYNLGFNSEPASVWSLPTEVRRDV